ncbi:MAG: hypothetical protein FWG50_11870 [Kiritimatiellaeota bacterium]|nr:hypothetical protein [Kiritimatiellota bacterium]
MNQQIQTIVDFLKTERMQVILVLLFIVLSAILTVNFVVLPQRETAEENRNMRQQLESSPYANQSFANMQAIADQELGNLQTLSNEWFRIAERLASIHGETVKGDVIDFKVQIYHVRTNLQQKSTQLNIPLVPEEFMDETLTSDESVRTRILQLKAIELLANLTLDRQIQKLVEIYPLSPIQHVDAKDQPTFSEYPVRVECDVDFDHLYTFFQSVFEEDRVFTFRNVRIESGPTFTSKLRVKAILSALLFE